MTAMDELNAKNTYGSARFGSSSVAPSMRPWSKGGQPTHVALHNDLGRNARCQRVKNSRWFSSFSERSVGVDECYASCGT